jgi:hypothetical protein
MEQKLSNLLMLLFLFAATVSIDVFLFIWNEIKGFDLMPGSQE